MKKKYSFIVYSAFLSVLLFFSTQLNSQSLSGSYTIGTSLTDDFSSFTMAIDSLTTLGVSGAVVMNAAGITFTESFTIGAITGASAANTITFRGQGNSTKIFYARSASEDRPLILLDGAGYIVFDSLMIESGDAAAGQMHLIHCKGATHHLTVSNCYLKVSDVSGGNGIVASSGVNIINGLANNLSNFTITNSTIEGGSYSNRLWNSSASYSHNMVFTNNTFTGFSFCGVNVRYSDGVTVLDNIIISRNPCANPRGMLLHNLSASMKVERNEIQLYGSDFIYAISLKAGCSFNAGSGIIANNFITQMIAGTNNSYVSRGIYFEGSVVNLKILNNSIRMNGGQSNASCIWCANSVTSGIWIQNNILANVNNGYCLYFTGTNFATQIFACDYNDFYYPTASAGNYNGSAKATLANWQASATNMDVHSVNLDPMFLSTSDLHVDPTNTALDNLGLSVTEVTHDIDGDPRSAQMPDIGADEFGNDTIIDVSVYRFVEPHLCSPALAQANITIMIKNNSVIPLSQIPVSYVIDNATPVTEVISSSIPSGDSLQFTFNTKADLSAGGNMVFSAYSHLVDDSVYFNDSIQGSFFINTVILDLGPDINICLGDVIQLDAGPGFGWHLWSTGATTQSISIDATSLGIGSYTYSIITGVSGCVDHDTIVVSVFDNPTVNIGSNISFKYHEHADTSIMVDAGPGYATYLWSTGATTQSIFVDTSFGPGVHNVWVIVSNAGGCTAQDNIEVNIIDDTGLEDIKNTLGFKLFPNPVAENLNIILDNSMGEISLKVMNLSGQITIEKQISNISGKLSLDTQHLPSGIYFIELSSKELQGKQMFIKK